MLSSFDGMAYQKLSSLFIAVFILHVPTTQTNTFYGCRALDITMTPFFDPISCSSGLYIAVQSALVGYSDEYSAQANKCPWTFKTAGDCPGQSVCSPVSVTSCCCIRSVLDGLLPDCSSSSCNLRQSLMIFILGTDALCSTSVHANFIVINYTCSATPPTSSTVSGPSTISTTTTTRSTSTSVTPTPSASSTVSEPSTISTTKMSSSSFITPSSTTTTMTLIPSLTSVIAGSSAVSSTSNSTSSVLTVDADGSYRQQSLSAGPIVGIAIGCMVFGIAVVLVPTLIWRNRAKRQSQTRVPSLPSPIELSTVSSSRDHQYEPLSFNSRQPAYVNVVPVFSN